jgi:hypothetical protein
MKDKGILFRTAPPRSSAIAVSVAIFFPAGIVAVVFFTYLTIINIDEWETKRTIQFILMIIMFIVGIWSSISTASHFWLSYYTINLMDDRVVAYNLWKQKREFFYTDIKAIKKRKGYNGLNLVLNNDEVIRLNGGIDDYGKLIETIKERAVNIQEVDYAGLDKNPLVWNNSYGWDYEKGRKIKGW